MYNVNFKATEGCPVSIGVKPSQHDDFAIEVSLYTPIEIPPDDKVPKNSRKIHLPLGNFTTVFL